VLVSAEPRVEYVLRRKITNDSKKELCEADSSLLIYDEGGNPHESPIYSSSIYLVNDSLGLPKSTRTRRRMIVLTAEFPASEKLVGQPLYASSLGEVRQATLSLSGEDENLIISDAVEKLEPVFPLSIAVSVRGWYSAPAAHQSRFRPSFEKIWHLTRTDPTDSHGGRGVEYDYEPY
jgi:hypothetical protein